MTIKPHLVHDRIILGVWLSDETLVLVFDWIIFGVWISDEILILVLNILLLGAWISNETPHPVFDLTILGVWISDETLIFVFNTIILIGCFSVFGDQLKHSYSSLIDYFEVYNEYQDVILNPARVFFPQGSNHLFWAKQNGVLSGKMLGGPRSSNAS